MRSAIQRVRDLVQLLQHDDFDEGPVLDLVIQCVLQLLDLQPQLGL